ncbi:MAG: DNA repair protein RadC [Bacteroidales bacterium]|nr:DNA repair protein RadC [Bacteroidales bacterium]
MKMCDICVEERPRERLIACGPESLGSAELLAVLLRNGTQGTSALDLSHALMTLAEGKLGNLSDMSMERICTVPGMGKCKAAVITAAFELGRRLLSEHAAGAALPIVTPRMVNDLMLPLLKSLRHEECWILCLSNSNTLIGKYRMTTGGQDSTVLDVRQVARLALEKSATAVIMVHNHPSGNPEPSKGDVRQTESLHKALETMKIELLDHVIVADDCFYSFDEGKKFSLL